jgi:hypothetical protein
VGAKQLHLRSWQQQQQQQQQLANLTQHPKMTAQLARWGSMHSCH